MESKDSAWVLLQLFEENCFFKAQVRVADFLVSIGNNVKWVCTNSRGLVETRKPDYGALYETFIGNHNYKDEDLIGRTIISNKEYLSTKKQVHGKIKNLIISESEVIQKMPNTKSLSKYVVEVGRKGPMKFSKQYKLGKKKERVKVSGNYIVEQLRNYSSQIIFTIQKNNSCTVDQMVLYFVEDKDKNIYFNRSKLCEISYKKQPMALPTTTTYLEHQLARPTYSSLRRAVSSTVGFSRKKPFECSGSFCNLVLESKELKSKEVDIDEFLNSVISSYFSGDEREIQKLKLSINMDKELNTRTKHKLRKPMNYIPYRYVLLGEKLTEGKLPTKELLSTDLKQVIETLEVFRKSQTSMDQLRIRAKIDSFNYYSQVLVCDRCYQVYSLLSSKRLLKSIQEKSPKLSSSLPRPAKKRLNSNNLDELLNDINQVLLEMELSERQLESSPEKTKRQENEEVLPKPQLKAEKVEEIGYENLSNQLFPQERLLPNVRFKGHRAYKSYLKKLKRGNLAKDRRSLVKLKH